MNVVKNVANQYAISKLNVSEIEDMIDSPKISSVLHKEFAKQALPRDFVFATYCVQGDSLMINKSASKTPLTDFTYQWPLLASDFVSAKSLLLVNFPLRYSFLLRSMGGMLLLSVLFTLIIIAAFVYSLHVIFSQKKLSEITNDFINNMTHELKTPLATISLTADTLGLSSVSQNAQMVDEYSVMIKNEVKKLSRHVDRILEAAVIERNGNGKPKEIVDMNELIQDEVKIFQAVVQARNGQIEVLLPPIPIRIHANKDMIRGALCNLLDNAIKYSKETPEIKISARRLSGKLLLSIEDRGIGIPKADQKMIFEKFYRAHTGNRHDVKGFGLGLSFVKNVVSSLEGKVWVESEPGKGSRFFIELPIE